VTKIDRCCRNTLEFLKIHEKLSNRKITFVALDMPYAADPAVYKLISTNLAAIATFENERRKERQKKGIEKAKREGRYPGRKSIITPKLIKKVRELKEDKNLSVSDIANATKVSRNTIYKILKEHLGYTNRNVLQLPDNLEQSKKKINKKK
jgi:DNA invertase Pin-like site-specific DNA recombinase